MLVIICLSQGGLRSLSASSLLGFLGFFFRGGRGGGWGRQKHNFFSGECTHWYLSCVRMDMVTSPGLLSETQVVLFGRWKVGGVVVRR